MSGGLFSGSLENMKKYSELFKRKTEEIYNDNWYQIDEAVMSMVHRDNPDLFDLYYGDYAGIISNYVSPIHNLDLIFRSSQKFLDHNKTKETYHLLQYCSKYFQDNPNSGLVFYYIQQHLIVDFYHNNRNITPRVIDLINLKITSEDNSDRERVNVLLHNNKRNLDLYGNKDLIITE